MGENGKIVNATPGQNAWNRPQNIGLVVGLPTRGKKVGLEWSIFFAYQQFPLNCNRELIVVKGKPVDEARITIAKKAIDSKAKYLFFLDDDVAAPTHAVKHLMYILESADDDVMVAGGIYCAKENPPYPMVFRGDGFGSFWKWKRGEVFECSSIGTGCMLIKTEVFAKLEEPWFFTDVNNRISDDLWFCDKVQKAGFKILADGNVLCDHWNYDTDPPIPFRLPKDSYPMKVDESTGVVA